jgi:tRNA 5-methylaminomethyl-2-thiouridine biosynthesis bifunctional protein
MSTRLPPAAAVAFDAAGIPHAQAFQDLYFSKDGGLAETNAVFLDGCDLPGAWAGSDSFVIGELGFGTGLNALAAWQAWRKSRPPGSVLHFVSVEGFPLDRAQAAAALQAFPEVADLAARLLAAWPVRAFGPQRLWFPDDGFALTVLLGPVETMLGAFDGPVDAWFLDGFAPARNPQMWTPEVLARLTAISRPGARLASYTAASAVRQDLATAGWHVEKRPGFGRKKDRIVARLPGEAPSPPRRPTRIAILGGGIAGACLAHASARRGLIPTLYLAGDALGDGASGNPAGLVMPRLDRGEGPPTEVLRSAYLAALSLYQNQTPDAFNPCGVLQRPDQDRAVAAFADLLADPPLPSAHLTKGECGALHHLGAGVLQPGLALAQLAAACTVTPNTKISALEHTEMGWQLHSDQGQRLDMADVVVIAAGAGLAHFPQTQWLPFALSRGQIECAVLADPPAQAITKGSYLAPIANAVVFGASFAPAAMDAQNAVPTATDRAENLSRLAALDKALVGRLDPNHITSRAAYRATTPDRLPIAGQAPDHAAWTSGHPGQNHAGLWLLGGLGARGLTLAPLLAEHLISLICHEPSPLGGANAAAIAPERFLWRALRRGKTL